MKHFKFTYHLLILLLLLISCKSTKFVPKDRYLLKKNKIEIKGEDVDEAELSSIIRQQPNRKMLGLKWDLFLYNRIDSAKVTDKRIRKNIENRFENQRRKLRQDKINERRILKSQRHNLPFYKKKNIELIDTLKSNMFLKEWLKYKVAEPPVVFDSVLYLKSIEQISEYLKKKGFYYSSVSGKLKYKKNRKVKVKYIVETGKQYMIDSIYYEVENTVVKQELEKFFLEHESNLKNQPFDSDVLDEYRNSIAHFLRDKAIYGYSPNSIRYEVDTNKLKTTVILGMNFQERKVFSEKVKDSLVIKKYQKTYVDNIYFHIIDTNSFNGNFKDTIRKLGLSLNGKYLPTIDTLFYDKIKQKNSENSTVNRMAYFLYNGNVFLNPLIIEVQSLLEKNGEITDFFIESTYSRLQQLGLFQTIKTEIIEIPETDKVQVHYYLIPAKKEVFSTQFRITTTQNSSQTGANTSSYFGLNLGLNYTNKNLFKGAEKFTFGLNTTLQAVPPVNDQKIDNSDLKELTTKFYQLEIGPSIKLELPGLFFIPKVKINKSRQAKTIFSGNYSLQKRDVYLKENIQFNSTWKYDIRNTQTIQMGIPLISVFQFVSIIKSADFESYLLEKNNPFLTNTFSKQFIWQDWRVSFEYRDKNKISKKRTSTFYYLGSFDLAGNLVSAFRKFQNVDTAGVNKGQYRVGGLIYSQFTKIDNTIIFTQPIRKNQSINLRTLIGAGLTYGNSNTSMPYDYSFFAGGSNDVRGWRPSSLGPGSYKHYLDTNGTSIQIGDLRLAISAEYRFQLNKKWKAALFIDAGNIWTVRKDNNRVGSQFSSDWYKEIGIAPGIGIRKDFGFFVARIDLGWPIHDPSLPIGARWIFQNHKEYFDEINNFIINNPGMSDNASNKISNSTLPFTPRLSFGIGYPF